MREWGGRRGGRCALVAGKNSMWGLWVSGRRWEGVEVNRNRVKAECCVVWYVSGMTVFV